MSQAAKAILALWGQTGKNRVNFFIKKITYILVTQRAF